jgi:hypothetical protein
LSPLIGSTASFVENSEHFIKLIQDINLQNEDYLVSSGIVSLFTNVPIEEGLQGVRNKLSADPSVPELTFTG